MSQQQKPTTEEPAATGRWLSASYANVKRALVGPHVATLKVAAQSASFQRGLRYASIAALILLIGTLGLLAAGTVPTLFGYNNYVINGGSMEPSLNVGSVVVTRPTSPFALEVGDIIARTDGADGSPVLHRVVEITDVDGQRAFITQGDQNRTPDATPVILAGNGDRVIYSVPYAGYILNFSRSLFGRTILLGVPLALLAIMSAKQAYTWRKRIGESGVGVATELGPVREPVPERPTERADEPVAIEAATPTAPPESEDEPAPIRNASTEARPETVPAGPDSPFPIEAALEAKANKKRASTLPQDHTPSETPGAGAKQPTLRAVPLPETPDDVPVFLLDQLRRRRATSPATRPQEPGERDVA